MKNTISFSALFPVAGFLSLSFAVKAQTRPNVVFIVIDDYGWADVGYNGSRFYETPNIDKLSAEGMIFTDGYAAAPISSPTRVSIMTGKNPARTGITDWIPGYQYGLDQQRLSKYKMLAPEMPLNMPLEEVTIGEALKEQGYKTFYVGKWHCCEDSLFYPQYQGFDVNIGGWMMGRPNGDMRKNGGRGAYFSPYHNPMLPDGPDGEYLTDRLGNECLKLIDSAGESPFFLFFSFYAVHTPIEAKPEVTKYFEDKARKMGLDTISPFTTDKDWIRNAPYKAWHWKERTVQNDAEYAALIWSMDENVGKVLDYLKKKGLYDNTVVCLLSDNGGLSTAEGSPTCNFPLRGGKGWLYEGGIRVPYIIRIPGSVGTVCHTPVSSTDFYPTILDLTGTDLKPEQHKDGVSLVPLLKGDTTFDRGAVYFHYPHYGGKGDTPAGAIRQGDYKLIWFYEDNHVELYNLRKDISEKENLAEVEWERAHSLWNRLQEYLRSCGAKMPVYNPNYKDVKH